MNNPIIICIVACCDEDRVSLRNSDINKVNLVLLRVGLGNNVNIILSNYMEVKNKGAHTIDLDDTHVVAINPEEETREGGGVQYTQTICFPGFEGESGILIETR